MTNLMSEPSTIDRLDGQSVVSFMQRHGLDFKTTDRLLGFNSQSKAPRRWIESGVPPHVDTIMAYIDTYGTEVAEGIAKKRDEAMAEAAKKMPGKKWYIQPLSAKAFKVPAEAIIRWREARQMTQPMFDRMFGFTSNGRSCRLWETNGAPAYAETFLAYVDRYGLDLAMAQVDRRGQNIATKVIH